MHCRFNGATAVRPWKSCERTRSSGLGDVSFNGATAVRPWKGAVGVTDARRETDGFNGATAVRPWKDGTPQSAVRLLPMLQWGHGGEAVESHRLCRSGQKHAGASMGPRR